MGGRSVGDRGIGLIRGQHRAGDLRIVHSLEAHQVPTGVHDGNRDQGTTDLRCFPACTGHPLRQRQVEQH